MRYRNWKWLVVALVVGATQARAGGGEDSGGTISGCVRLAGRPPAITAYAVEHDLEVCGGQARLAQSLELGSSQVVANVVVYLGAPGPTPPKQPLPLRRPDGRALPTPVGPAPAPLILEQQHCELVPRIQVARSGAPLIVQNSDPLLHILRFEVLGATNGPTCLHRLATPYAGFERKCDWLGFARPTVVKITGENGHEWMTAYIAVLPHPWAVLTDARGRFRLGSVPPGRYQLFAWHEVLGTLASEVTVTGHRPVIVDLEFRGADQPADSLKP